MSKIDWDKDKRRRQERQARAADRYEEMQQKWLERRILRKGMSQSKQAEAVQKLMELRKK